MLTTQAMIDAVDGPEVQPRRRTPPTAQTSALYRDLTRLLERLITADPALRAQVTATLRRGPAMTIDRLEAVVDTHDALRDGIVTFVLDHVDYEALAARLGAQDTRSDETTR